MNVKDTWEYFGGSKLMWYLRWREFQSIRVKAMKKNG